MASNPPGYPPQGYQDPAQYGQEVAQQYAGTPQPDYDQQAAPVPGQVGGKKKRAYAGQAFEFGTGANAGQQAPPAGGAYPVAQPAGYGYPQQQQQPQAMGYQQPGYGDAAAAQPAQAVYAQPGYAAPAAYQAPDASYPAPGAAPLAQPGIAGVTQQFSQMGMAQQPQQAPAQPAAAMQRLNPLQPVDLSAQGQPFQVADLDLPPPPIILPPNVCAVETRPVAAPLPLLTICAVECDPLTRRQLPSQVHSLHIERYSLDKLSAQKVKASFRACHPAICHPARRRGQRPRTTRSSHRAMQKMPNLHQSVCHLPRPQPQVEV